MLKFQFHKGTIRTEEQKDRCKIALYFNSIKVQLELYIRKMFIIIRKFQFHKGTIRTNLCAQIIIYNLYFNSIKVQLEQVSDEEYFQPYRYFNSIKVQLELIFSLAVCV